MDAQAILTGDALDLIPTLDNESVQLVVTSPPYPGQYGNTLESWQWLHWANRWLRALEPKLSPAGVIALNVQFKRTASGWYDSLVLQLGGDGWHPYNVLDLYVYGKPNPPPNGALTFCDPPGWEFVFVLTKAVRPEDVYFEPVRRPYARKSIRPDGTLYSNMSRQSPAPHPDGARQTTLLLASMSGDQNRPRAAGISFPRALPERFIRQYTRPGDLVLDPFCGVGTTVRVARELGRRAIGIELDAAEAERARAWLAEPLQGRLEVTR